MKLKCLCSVLWRDLLVVFILGKRIEETSVDNVNRLAKKGFLLQDVGTRYWSTSCGGFDSTFIYKLYRPSLAAKLMSKGINCNILKRAVAGCLSLVPNIKKNPPVLEKVLDGDGGSAVGIKLLKTEEFGGVHGGSGNREKFSTNDDVMAAADNQAPTKETTL